MVFTAEAAFAAASWPGLSKSSYCEFTATKNINVYRNSACTTRGTSSPAKSYSAYIAKNDVCKIYKITTSYVDLAYPTSSGYKRGYIKRSHLLGVSAPAEAVTSKGKVTTYKTASTASYHGYVAKGDKVYKVGASGSYTYIIYQAKSGKRAYKLAYVQTAKYNNGIKSTKQQSTSASPNYTARTTAPSKSNKYYYSGKNVFYKSGYGMPNCTAYAYGRAYELLGSKPKLCTRSAGAWYGYNKSNRCYSYGSTPKLGAVACWSKNGTSTGHVAVVEKINGNGTVLISESHWKGTNFNTRTMKSNGSNYLKSYIFQGYIYIK